MYRFILSAIWSLNIFVGMPLAGHPGHTHTEKQRQYHHGGSMARGTILDFFHNNAEEHSQQIYHIAQRFEHSREQLTSTTNNRPEIEQLFVEDCAARCHDNHIIPAHMSDDGFLRIVSFNVRLWTDVTWHDRFDETWEVIAQINPDILVLQEVALDERTERIAEKLRTLGFHLSNEWIQHQTQSFTAGAYRATNLVVTKSVPVTTRAQSFEHDTLGYVRVEVQLSSGKSIVVYGTHLDVIDTTEQIRTHEMYELLTCAIHDIQAKKQVIIAGDLNSIDMKNYKVMNSHSISLQDLITLQYRMYRGCTTEEEVPQLVASMWKGAGFVDSFSLAEQQNPLWTSWWGGRTDYVLCSPQLKPMIHGNYVYYTSVSDHLPIIVDLIAS